MKVSHRCATEEGVQTELEPLLYCQIEAADEHAHVRILKYEAVNRRRYARSCRESAVSSDPLNDRLVHHRVGCVLDAVRRTVDFGSSTMLGSVTNLC